MKKFNALKFIIRMLKVGAWLTVGFTLILIIVAVISMFRDDYFYMGSGYWLNQMLIFAGMTTAGLIVAMLIYGAAELLDLLITIQENTYSTANVLRNMYRDQLNSQNVEAIHSTRERTVRLRDVDAEGNVVEADLPVTGSNGSRR